jgi:hypothetical protein
LFPECQDRIFDPGADFKHRGQFSQFQHMPDLFAGRSQLDRAPQAASPGQHECQSPQSGAVDHVHATQLQYELSRVRQQVGDLLGQGGSFITVGDAAPATHYRGFLGMADFQI